MPHRSKSVHAIALLDGVWDVHGNLRLIVFREDDIFIQHADIGLLREILAKRPGRLPVARKKGKGKRKR